MWIVEILDTTNHVINEYLLRGPELKIGRLNGDDYIPIIQNNDKTVSRDHARVTINNDILSIIDNNSKFGTFIDDKSNTKINETYQVKSGQIIKFGAAVTRLRFLKCQYIFSTTLISKDERERIKKLSKVLGARIINNVEDSSHLICPKYGATTKMLTAIVLEKKIITTSWLSFVEEPSNQKLSLVPKCVDYSPPATDEFNSYIATAHLKRSELLKNYTVFVTMKADMQYGPIFKQCASNVIDLSHIDDKSLLRETIKNSDLPQHTSVVCIFYDMINYKTGSSVPSSSVSPIVDASFLPENESIGFSDGNVPLLWLSAEKLAVAIIKCEQPELSKYFMTSNKSQLSSQKLFTAQYQFDSLNQNSSSSPLPKKSPSANAKFNINIPSLRPNTVIDEEEIQTIVVSKPLVPVFVIGSKLSPLKSTAQSTVELKQSVIYEEEIGHVEKVKLTTKRGRNDDINEIDEDIDNSKLKKRKESIAVVKRTQDLQLSNDIMMSDEDKMAENYGQDVTEYVEEFEEVMDPYMELQALQDFENNNVNAIDDDGWIAPPPLNLRKAIAEKNRKALDDEYKYLEPAETKRVKNLIRKIPVNNIRQSTALNKNPKSSKDQRKFKKNIIFFATDDEMLHLRDMEKVLPKESSREKQLRLEEEQIHEELISDDDDDDAIVAKHFSKKKTTTRKSK